MGMAERIKEQRKAKGYTQTELGEKLGLQASAIAKYENGRVENMKRSIIKKMATVLECSPTYLMGLDEKSDKDETPKIMHYYNQLNSIGKQVATDRVKEMTEVPRYTKEDTDQPIQPHTIAAHFDGDELTTDELEEIAEFEKIVKNRKK